jgi:hypothetical protein
MLLVRRVILRCSGTPLGNGALAGGLGLEDELLVMFAKVGELICTPAGDRQCVTLRQRQMHDRRLKCDPR